MAQVEKKLPPEERVIGAEFLAGAAAADKSGGAGHLRCGHCIFRGDPLHTKLGDASQFQKLSDTHPPLLIAMIE